VPTTNHPDEKIFYDEITLVLEVVRTYFTILCEDINAKTGVAKMDNTEIAIGNLESGLKIHRGEILLKCLL
jgi:hypothetical protein